MPYVPWNIPSKVVLFARLEQKTWPVVRSIAIPVPRMKKLCTELSQAVGVYRESIAYEAHNAGNGGARIIEIYPRMSRSSAITSVLPRPRFSVKTPRMRAVTRHPAAVHRKMIATVPY